MVFFRNTIAFYLVLLCAAIITVSRHGFVVAMELEQQGEWAISEDCAFFSKAIQINPDGNQLIDRNCVNE